MDDTTIQLDLACPCGWSDTMLANPRSIPACPCGTCEAPDWVCPACETAHQLPAAQWAQIRLDDPHSAHLGNRAQRRAHRRPRRTR